MFDTRNDEYYVKFQRSEKIRKEHHNFQNVYRNILLKEVTREVSKSVGG